METIRRACNRISHWRLYYRAKYFVLFILVTAAVYLFIIDRNVIANLIRPTLANRMTVCSDPRPDRIHPSLRSTVYERPTPGGNDVPEKARIPRILHQTYKSHLIPGPLVKYVKSWARQHPNWTYVFWTDEDIQEFVTRFYPAAVHILSQLPKRTLSGSHGPIYWCDIVRYLIMDFFGGVYSDLDTESLRPLDPLLKTHFAVVSREPEHFALSAGRETLIQASNAFLMFAPGHQLWNIVLRTIDDQTHGFPLDPVTVTGPVMLDEAVRQYRCGKPLTLHGENSVFLAPSAMFFGWHPWVEAQWRKDWILKTCFAIRFRGFRDNSVGKLCDKLRETGEIDLSLVKKIKKSEHFVVHHGSQVYENDRLKTNEDKTPVHIRKIFPKFKTFRDLL